MIYAQIFSVFFRFAAVSFGGVYGLLNQIEAALVEGHHWITHDQFVAAFVVGQLVPGPNVAMCPMIGYQIAGFGGWLAAFLAVYSVPLLMMGAAFAIYGRLRHVPWVRRLELALRPLVFGLILASCVNLFWQQARPHPVAASAVTAAGAFLYGRGRATALQTLFGLAFVWWLAVLGVHTLTHT